MSNRHENVVARLNTIPGYREQFAHVVGSPEVTIEHVGKAMAGLCVASYSYRARPLPGARRAHTGSIRSLSGTAERSQLQDVSAVQNGKLFVRGP